MASMFLFFKQLEQIQSKNEIKKKRKQYDIVKAAYIVTLFR